MLALAAIGSRSEPVPHRPSVAVGSYLQCPAAILMFSCWTARIAKKGRATCLENPKAMQQRRIETWDRGCNALPQHRGRQLPPSVLAFPLSARLSATGL